jgi:hypothetical protein
MPPTDDLSARDLRKRLAVLKERKRHLDACRAAALRWASKDVVRRPTEQERQGARSSAETELDSLRQQIRRVHDLLGVVRYERGLHRPTRRAQRYFAPTARRILTRPRPRLTRPAVLCRPREHRFRRSQRSSSARGDPDPSEPPLKLEKAGL